MSLFAPEESWTLTLSPFISHLSLALPSPQGFRNLYMLTCPVSATFPFTQEMESLQRSCNALCMKEFNFIAATCAKAKSRQRRSHRSPKELWKSRSHSPEPWFSSCTQGLPSPLQSCQKVWSSSTAWAPVGSQETQESQDYGSTVGLTLTMSGKFQSHCSKENPGTWKGL